MEKLTILRMFFCFPFFGLLLPDTGLILTGSPIHVPLIRIGIEIGLLVCILLCTAAITYGKKRGQGMQDKTNEASFS
jgi:hypothetical protein